MIKKILIASMLFSTVSYSYAGRVTPLPIPGGSSMSQARGVIPLEISDPTPAQGKWVMVEGYSNLSAGTEVARKQALLDAYRRAINTGGSIEIGEFSQLRNFKDVVDVITKRAHGFIKEYELLAEGPDTNRANTYMVAIKALVVDKLDRNETGEEGLAQFVSLIGSPKVLFILSEKNRSRSAAGLNAQASSNLEIQHNGTSVSISESSTTGISNSFNHPQEDTSTSEHIMAEEFRRVGYEVITSDDVLQSGFVTQSSIDKARRGLGSYAAEVGKSVGADIVISGVVKYQVSSAGSGGTDVSGAQMGTVSLTSKAILPSNGRVLHVSTRRQGYMSVQYASQLLAQEEAISKAARFAGNELMWQIPKLLSEQTQDVALSLKNTSYQSAEDVRRYLSGLNGVEQVLMLGWKNGLAKYQVKSVFTGPREGDIVQALSGKYSKFSVDEVSYFNVVGKL